MTQPYRHPRPDVVVVGGGIGGLGTALALTRAGQRVRVLEQASAFGEVGAGLQMAPNATRILRDWELLDAVVDHGVVPERLVMRDAVDGAELTHLDLSDVERRYGAPYVVIHRSDLHAILLRACRDAGVDLVTDAEVRDVEPRPDGVAAVATDREDAAAVVIAADGLGSRLRSRLSDDRPVDSYFVAYRGAVPVAEVAHLGGRVPTDVVVYIGPDCHLVQYPLRRGEMFNQVAVFRSPSAVRGEPTSGTPEELAAAFAGMCDEVRRALPSLWQDRHWAMFDREPLTRWVHGRLALVGDAAHPMLQYLAQGACQALEDAHCLAALADPQAERPVDWDRVLTDYVAARGPRTAEVQRRARLWGELWHCDGLARSVRNALLTDRAPDDYRHVDWLYGS